MSAFREVGGQVGHVHVEAALGGRGRVPKTSFSVRDIGRGKEGSTMRGQGPWGMQGGDTPVSASMCMKLGDKSASIATNIVPRGGHEPHGERRAIEPHVLELDHLEATLSQCLHTF